MFVDVCFPEGNEHEFLRMARYIGIDGMCFVYEKDQKKKPEYDFKVFTACRRQGGKYLFSDNLNLNQKNVFYYYVPKKEEGRFNAPIKSITHVTLNGIREHGGCIGISMSALMRSQCFEEAAFIVRLALKCNVGLFCASFAYRPYDLVPRESQLSAMRLLSSNTNASKMALDTLSKRF